MAAATECCRTLPVQDLAGKQAQHLHREKLHPSKLVLAMENPPGGLLILSLVQSVNCQIFMIQRPDPSLAADRLNSRVSPGPPSPRKTRCS